MKPRRHVFMFKPCFAPLVLAGTKRSTIRPERKRIVRVGDHLDLRQWSGAPYRSPQLLLRNEACIEASPIKILDYWIVLNGKDLPLAKMQELARADGFRDCVELTEWFRATHGLPFKGTLYRWMP